MIKHPCPVCRHAETFRARMRGDEPCYDDPPTLRWCPPYGGPQGQQLTRWSAGWWECEECEWKAEPYTAGLIMDAVLRHSDPECDSIGEDGLHADTRDVLNGGIRS